MKNVFKFESLYTLKPGVLFFVPDNLENYKKKKPTKGFGSIRYPEGSVYTGDIYFDGKDYNKLGYGKQDFTYSTLGVLNESINRKNYLYVGEYDYRRTDWIYGNGVLYYKDKDGNPCGYSKGFFEGLRRADEWVGEFDPNIILEEYRNTKEIIENPWKNVIENEIKDYKAIKNLDILVFGDSYTEFWHYKEFAGKNLFKKMFDPSKDLNIGIGGTRFIDWNKEFLVYLKKVKSPKHILVHLGYNDLHSNFSVNSVYNEMVKTICFLRAHFPKAEIYLPTIAKSPAMEKFYEREEELSKKFYKYAKIEGHLHILPLREELDKNDGLATCFVSDGVHLNEKGYKVYFDLIMKNLKK